MKDSNFKTPRTLRECQFIEGHDPIEAFYCGGNILLPALLAVGTIIAALVGFIVWRALA